MYDLEPASEQIECECKPCPACDEDGSVVLGDASNGDTLTRNKCLQCNGTGVDGQDCPVHADVDGERYPNGVCCRVFAETGKGHAYNCGNYAPVMAYQVDFQEAL